MQEAPLKRYRLPVRRVGGGSVMLNSGLTEAELHARVHQGLFLLARSIHDRIDAGLPDDLRGDWRQQFSVNAHPISRADFTAFIRLLTDRSEYRDDVREAFGLQWYRDEEVQNALHGVKRVRDRASHPDGWTKSEAEAALSLFARCANRIRLPCADEIHAIRATLTSEDRTVRQRMSAEEESALRQQVADHLSDKQAAVAERNEMAALLDAKDEEVAQLRHEAETARQQAEEVKAALESQALADADKDRLQSELKQLRAEQEQVNRRMEEALARSQEAETALQEAEERRLLSEDELARLQEDYALERAHARSTNADDEELEAIDDRVALVREVLASALGESAPQSSQFASASPDQLPRPGEQWPYLHGREAWRLSKVARQMTRASDDRDLSNLVGAAAAKHAVDSFLRIRPTGGRVWVDEDGDASTLISGVLTYLGNIYPSIDDPQQAGPLIGTPIEPSGRRYTLNRKTGVVCAADGQELRDVVGKAVADQVRDRLLAIRPSGGRLRVSTTGVVATFLDGDWVVAGTVTPDEWFPGHLL